VRFQELSGVGRRMANGTDEDEAQAERVDGWIVWETEEREEGGKCDLSLLVFFTMLRPRVFLVRAVCISLRDEKGPKQKCDSNKIIKFH